MRRSFISLIGLLLTIAACGGGQGIETTPSSAPGQDILGDATHGGELFERTCQACHGPNAAGIEGIGKPFVGSEFIASQSDVQLIEFLKAGRASEDPLNTTGILMPPKGGNPSLTDADLADIVAWIRTLG